MLTETFCHVPGIGREIERQLWQDGCTDWECFLADPPKYRCGTAGVGLTTDVITQSQVALALGNHQFFAQHLGQGLAWRAWPEFQDSCVYLDIETDGGRNGSSITMVGLYDRNGFKCLVRDDNLENFRDVISHYSMIVTFFGSVFDLPMLKKRFRGLVMDQIHLDLCFALKEVGYRGGLKKIEKQLGIDRPDAVDGLKGLDAIRLWREFERGKDSSLETLIAYNREDVQNLPRLTKIAYDALKQKSQEPLHCA